MHKMFILNQVSGKFLDMVSCSGSCYELRRTTMIKEMF